VPVSSNMLSVLLEKAVFPHDFASITFYTVDTVNDSLRYCREAVARVFCIDNLDYTDSREKAYFDHQLVNIS
jgi:hypothetical protein